jgi:capsular exopolysaccharide synthesis family protein
MNQEKSRIPSTPSQGSEPEFPSQSLNQVRDEESLREIVRVLRKRKYFILSIALGVFVAGLLLCVVMRPQYKSTATMLVDKESGGGLDLGSLSSLASAVGGSDDLKVEMGTHIAILQSDSNALAVYNELNLKDVVPYKFNPGLLESLRFGGKIKAEKGLPIENAPITRERFLKLFAKHLKVDSTPDTRLITVAYRDYDPQRAAAIANSLVDNYTREYLHSRYQATARATDWLSGQLGVLKKNVDDTQKKLTDYEHESGLSVLMLGLSMGTGGDSGPSGGASAGGGGVHIPAVDKLAALNQELTAAEANRIAKEAIYRLTETQSPEVVLGLGSSDLSSVGGGSAVISQGNGLAVLQGLRQQEAAVKMNYADISTKYGARNPRLAEIQGQINALDDQIHQELKRISQRALNDFTLAQKSEDGVRKEYAKQEEVVGHTNDGMIQLEILAGEALSSRALYEGLSTKLQAAGVEAGVKATNLSLVDPARPPAAQSRPDWLIYPGIALAAGLLLGVAGAFVKENLDDAVVTSDQAERISGYPVMSNIPLIRREDLAAVTPSGETQDQSLLLSSPHSPIAESYRSLRTAIQLSAVDKPLQVLLVSSPLGSDGKSTISYNTAIAFAQQGRRVLLVDVDLRKSRLHHLFGVDRSPGLSEVLTGQASLEAAVRPHNSVEGFFLLPAGTLPPNPADLVASHRFDDLLALLRGQYDLIILDSPPILLVTDAAILSGKADGIIVVIRSGVTTQPVLARVSALLHRGAGHMLGLVLNAVDTRSVEYYYSYGYYGGSKYYGEEDSQS